MGQVVLDCLYFLTETDANAAKLRLAMRTGALENATGAREGGQEVLEETSMFLSILEGFLMVLSMEGDMIFLSENVSQHMSLTQVQ